MSQSKIRINFASIVDNKKLPKTAPLLPLFEAIINSIQSINEAKITNGKIDINVIRTESLLVTSEWETNIESFEIIDNGIGFNDANFDSFDVYGSDHKALLGCKGVGRIIWLKAFTNVLIESTYLGTDNNFYDRKFEFSISDEIKVMKNERSNKNQVYTKVKLCRIKKQYKHECRKKIDSLAKEIMNHCFTYLALNKCPLITISDGQTSKNVNELYKESVKDSQKIIEIEIKEQPFTLINTKHYFTSSTSHLLHFCADDREVTSENLSKIITELSGKLSNEHGDFVYNGYLRSSILDKNVNSERTDFVFSIKKAEDGDDSDSEQLEFDFDDSNQSISKKDIFDVVTPHIREYLYNEIEEYNKTRQDRINDFVYNHNPIYRSLLRYSPECIKAIPLSDDDKKLELELFKQYQIYKLKIKQEQTEFIKDNIATVKDFEKYSKRKSELLEKTSALGKDKLAEYIIQRKVILEILENNLGNTEITNNGYALERDIHKIVFPMVKTSDDIDYTKHNLWIIDERLAYHYYLASDKSLSSCSMLENDSTNQPDILIFNNPFALTGDSNRDLLNNITIIEFKRPGREDKDCIDQVIKYIDDIRNGKCKDKNGLVLAEMKSKDIRFTCYILCDISGKMASYFDSKNYRITPDGECRYFYHDIFNAYIEVIPYRTLLNNSYKRNNILFDTLFCQRPDLSF